MGKSHKRNFSAVICLTVMIVIFGYFGYVMGISNMLKTMMNTAHDLVLNTCLFLMAVCVLTGAIGSLFVEFGVVNLLEKLLRPLMKPLFNMPGAAALGAVVTFLSDNPALITMAKDSRYASFFRKFQFISLTNFGTAFGMGLIVIVFMVSFGYSWEPFVGLFGAIAGCIVSTRLMQKFIIMDLPSYKDEYAAVCSETEENTSEESLKKTSTFIRVLNGLLDGGKSGVMVGVAIIPGVLIVSTFVMMLTFDTGSVEEYTGVAYQGTALFPYIAEKLDFLFDILFGFNDPHQIAFPITSLGAVGAALGLVPAFIEQGWIDGNAIAVFTAMGMCWSGFLSTHTAMLDTLGYRNLTGKAILSHTIGGIVAGIIAHWTFIVLSLF
ncbi:MAG: hypothetical protein KBS57_03030 [Alistipes sp.]|nr:hypothetical protein [Candidatus Minthomonas equi]